MLLLPLLVFLSSGADSSPLGQQRRVPPSFPGLRSVKELAGAAGYNASDVEVMTEDGYSLWMHRIGENDGPPVLLMHGLFLASESWLVRAHNRGLVFQLLKEGFDVWLANQRGTVYNEYNVNYNRSDPRFWNFSFHEAGYYDIPAFIDTILEIRRTQQLFYIGHSLGTTVFLVMASTRPEYNAKVRAAALLSPVAFAPLYKDLSLFHRMLFGNADTIYRGLQLMGRLEVGSRSSSTIRFLKEMCGERSYLQPLCMDFVGMFAGENRNNMDKKEYGVFMSYIGAGSSLKTALHTAQIYLTGEFKQFDYGDEKQNLLRYNSSRPPKYNLDLVKAPVALFWGYNDPLLSKESVQKLASALPNLLFSKAVPDPLFTHGDVLLGMNSDKVLCPDIVNLFKNMLREEETKRGNQLSFQSGPKMNI